MCNAAREACKRFPGENSKICLLNTCCAVVEPVAHLARINYQ